MTDFDLRIETLSPSVLEELDERDRELLFGAPSVSSGRKPLQGLAADSQIELVPEADPGPSIEALAAGYVDLNVTAGGVLDRIEARSGELVLAVDPVAQPQLFAAVNSLFASEEPVTRVTFAMYRKCLVYAKDVGLALGDQV